MTAARSPEPEVLQHVLDVLKSLVELLARFGQRDRAEWLEERRSKVGSRASSVEDVTRIFGELHGVVLGMGGLTDLHLQSNSPAETDNINEDLDQLADQLFELTR